MSLKKTFAIALVMMLLAVSFSFAENLEKENALPAIPSEPTNECLSQDEAVGIVKQKMADAYQRPLSDFDCHNCAGKRRRCMGCDGGSQQ